MSSRVSFSFPRLSEDGDLSFPSDVLHNLLNLLPRRDALSLFRTSRAHLKALLAVSFLRSHYQSRISVFDDLYSAAERISGADYPLSVLISVANPPFVHRVEAGDVRAVRVLAERGADVNFKVDIRRGYTSLMLAVQKGHDLCARALLEAGAEIDKARSDGYTALMDACLDGHEQCARALIEAGATVDAVNNEGVTALIKAAEKGHERVCASRLEHSHLLLGPHKPFRITSSAPGH